MTKVCYEDEETSNENRTNKIPTHSIIEIDAPDRNGVLDGLLEILYEIGIPFGSKVYNEEEIISGVVSFCEIKNKKYNVGGRALSVDIYTDTDEIKFRTRCKEYKKITGISTRNPFGTSELSDLETLLSLGRKIQNITEE